MKKLVVLLTVILIPVMACSQSQQDWTELMYHYQTGSVPPQYYFSYDMTVAQSGILTLVYHPGYQTDSSWTYQLNVPADDIAHLNNAIKASGILNGTIPEAPQEHRPVGGPIQHVMLMLPQDPNLDQMPPRITTPDFPDDAYREKLAVLYEQIQKLVPASTWNEIETRRGLKDK
ncbi:MAG: hypothetical protein EHM58_06255 [Ignavibacteriae bacterium]|nr:MAG: hypothetical protein EHM58_06255 [Ignavibacteriota bacterium]